MYENTYLFVVLCGETVDYWKGTFVSLLLGQHNATSVDANIMFNTDVALVGDASSTRTYSLTSIVDGKAIRANPAAPLGEPETLTVSHSLRNPKDPLSATRHLVRLDLTKSNVDGEKETGSVYVVVEAPKQIITSVQLSDMVTQLKNFLIASGYLAKLLNSEP